MKSGGSGSQVTSKGAVVVSMMGQGDRQKLGQQHHFIRGRADSKVTLIIVKRMINLVQH